MTLSLFLASLVFCEETEAPAESSLPLKPSGGYFHFQSFGNDDWDKTWHPSSVSNVTGIWKIQNTNVPQSFPDEKMIFMTTEKAYYGLSTALSQPLDLTSKTLVVQYETRWQEFLDCGGAYIKLFHSDNFSPAELSNETRYIIMFGPDKCGATNKVHFIFRHKSPKTGVYEEKHLKEPPTPKSDRINHLYTLIVRPDNSFEILIDGESAKNGSLTSDFSPSVNPPKEIDDPTDIKPEDWVDDEKIDDPEAKKPDDWDETQPELIKDPAKLNPPEGWLVDEPKFIPDPNAQPPDDWDEVIHGAWEPPNIPNPKCEAAPGCGEYEAPVIKNSLYKGKWVAPKIPNPAYKGPWKAKQIPNPDYFEDPHPSHFEPIIGAGFEIWMVNKDIGFSNIYIGTDEAAVTQWNNEHFIPKHKKQEEEQKKLEPKTPGKGTGFVAKLGAFFTTVKGAWINLYSENAVLSIVIVSLIVLVPIILCITCCRGSKKTQVQKQKPAEAAPSEPPVATTETPKEETPAEGEPGKKEETPAPAHEEEEVPAEQTIGTKPQEAAQKREKGGHGNDE